jgi:hypothetical protein
MGVSQTVSLRRGGRIVIRPTTVLLLLIASIVLWWQATPTVAQPACQFLEGFATLRELVGADTVGDCLEDEHVNADTGDIEQRTTGGLLVQRAIDNVGEFSDGVTSWVNGPDGLQSRPSGERFSWESDPGRVSASASAGADADAALLPNIPSLFGVAPPPSSATEPRGASAPATPVTPPSIPTPTPPTAPGSFATPTRAATPGRPAAPTSAPAAGRTDPVGGQCPSTHRIKGVTSGGQKLFYEPERPEYAKATPEVCFTAGGDARDAGYVSGKR